MEKKFEDMNDLEKTIHNEKVIIAGHRRSIDILEQHRAPFITICTIEADIRDREQWVKSLEEKLARPSCNYCGARENIKPDMAGHVCMDQVECAKRWSVK